MRGKYMVAFNDDLSVDFSMDFNQVTDKRDSDDMATEAEERGDLSRRKAEKRFVKFNVMKDAQIKEFGQVGMPSYGECVVILSVGSFNAYSMIQHVLNMSKIERLQITTFNMHQDVITGIFGMFDSGRITNLDIILSESVRFRMPKRYDQMMAEFEKHKSTGRVRVKYNWNHSKVILMDTGSNKYCVSGSGNLSDNAQFEQYYITCDCADYDFFTQWIDGEFTGENYKREKVLR